MHEQLLKLMTLDRLVEAIGTAKLKALVDRILPVIELLEGLGAKSDVDVAAVRRLLADLPTTGPIPVVVEPPPPSVSLGRYLEQVGSLVTNIAGDGPAAMADGETTQVYIGPNALRADGAVVGQCFVSLMTQPNGAPLWRERYVFADADDWLEGKIEIVRSSGAWDTISGSEQRARKERDIYLNATDTSPAKAWLATVDFEYAIPPDAATRSAMIAEAAKLTAPVDRRLFEVVTKINGPLVVQGWLLRESFTVGTRTMILDHWRLKHDYLFPAAGRPVAFRPSVAPATLASFFALAAEYEATPGGTSDPKHGWYVQTTYQMQPA